MNPNAAQKIAEGFLQGAGAAFETMLSLPFQHELEEPQALTEPLAQALLKDHPVVMQAALEGQPGAVALMFGLTDALLIVGMVRRTETSGKDALDDGDRSILQDVAEQALSGGVASLMERFERDAPPLENLLVTDAGLAAFPGLEALLGPGPGAVAFRVVSPPGFSAKVILAYSQRLEELTLAEEAPRESAPAAGEASPGAALSPAEVQDILSGFGPQKGGTSMAGAGNDLNREVRQHSDNLDMVYDIRLEATARLGRVELPIGSILNLGPGSIVEVGHMVDEPVELYINDKLIARGDVVVVDEKFGLRITEIVSARERIESLR
jgi:flagellar motor switch protein FliN/FliY